jgi:hypothetical protein
MREKLKKSLSKDNGNLWNFYDALAERYYTLRDKNVIPNNLINIYLPLGVQFLNYLKNLDKIKNNKKPTNLLQKKFPIFWFDFLKQNNYKTTKELHNYSYELPYMGPKTPTIYITYTNNGNGPKKVKELFKKINKMKKGDLIDLELNLDNFNSKSDKNMLTNLLNNKKVKIIINSS